MKTRSWRRPRRPLVATALAFALVLGSGLIRAEAATSARQAHRAAAHGAAPTALSAVQQWVNRLLAAVGLAPSTPLVTAVPLPATADDSDNGAGIDPNG